MNMKNRTLYCFLGLFALGVSCTSVSSEVTFLGFNVVCFLFYSILVSRTYVYLCQIYVVISKLQIFGT